MGSLRKQPTFGDATTTGFPAKKTEGTVILKFRRNRKTYEMFFFKIKKKDDGD